MHSIEEYIEGTRSAVQKLYQAVDSYYDLLREPQRPAFTFWGEYNEKVRRTHEKWTEENKTVLEERASRDEKFAAETFAIATLCGSILQFPSMAIEICSKNTKSHHKFLDLIPDNHKVAKFCIGREVNEVPIGLIIYAGRNQAHHYDDKQYGKVTERVFQNLATWYSPTFNKSFTDSRLDLSNENVINFAANILWLLEWQNYESYEFGLRDLFK